MKTIDTSHRLVALIGSESKRLKDYVRSLSPEALENPSPCDRWNVGEVIGHLIWFADTYGSMIERGLKGDQSPTEGLPAVPGTLNGSEIAQLYGDTAIELRRTLGEGLIQEFCDRYDWLNAMLQSIGPDDWDKPCYHTLKIRPVEFFMPVIVQELAVHEWDIRSTIEASPQVSKQTIPALITKLPNTRRPWSTPFKSETASSGRICLRFALTDLGDRWDVIVEGGQARMESSGNDPADLTLTSDSSNFVLLMYGRLTVVASVGSGRFTADGEVGLMPDIDRWLSGD